MSRTIKKPTEKEEKKPRLKPKKPKYKHLLFIIVLIILSISMSCKAQEHSTFSDTTFSMTVLKDCRDSTHGFPVSKEMQKFLDSFESVSTVTITDYQGEAFVDGQYRECIIINRIVFELTGRKQGWLWKSTKNHLLAVWIS